MPSFEPVQTSSLINTFPFSDDQVGSLDSFDPFEGITSTHSALSLRSLRSSSNLVANNSDNYDYHYGHPKSFLALNRLATITHVSGAKANIQSLPLEILQQILQELLVSMSETVYYTRIKQFAQILTVCSSFYDAGTSILYRHVAFAHPHAFDKFLNSIRMSGYGFLVRTLDFSDFTSVGLGRTARMNKEIQMVTSRTLSDVLDLCPNLNEFLASESIDKDLDESVIKKLLAMQYISAVDFCGSTDSAFTQAITSLPPPSRDCYWNLSRLSFHGCSTLPSAAFEAILPRLPNLTRLDLTHTQVTVKALLSLPKTAVLTHLSLAKCVQLNSEGILKFLVLHPATRSLEWLNLMFEATRPSPLSVADISTILRYLPPLKHLNLHGLPISEANVDSLISMDLRSLSLGFADISLERLKTFLPKLSQLEYLDLTGNPYINIWTVQDISLLNSNPNIRMFEFSSDLLTKLNGITIPGFCIALGQGRRGWAFRGDHVPINKTLSTVQHKGPSVVNGPEVSDPSKSPVVVPSTGFSFSAYAKTRIRERSTSPQKESDSKPITVLGMDMGSRSWVHASRKINMCFVGVGGNMSVEACKERGIYLYYGYRK